MISGFWCEKERKREGGVCNLGRAHMEKPRPRKTKDWLPGEEWIGRSFVMGMSRLYKDLQSYWKKKSLKLSGLKAWPPNLCLFFVDLFPRRQEVSYSSPSSAWASAAASLQARQYDLSKVMIPHPATFLRLEKVLFQIHLKCNTRSTPTWEKNHKLHPLPSLILDLF